MPKLFKLVYHFVNSYGTWGYHLGAKRRRIKVNTSPTNKGDVFGLRGLQLTNGSVTSKKNLPDLIKSSSGFFSVVALIFFLDNCVPRKSLTVKYSRKQSFPRKKTKEKYKIHKCQWWKCSFQKLFGMWTRVYSRSIIVDNYTWSFYWCYLLPGSKLLHQHSPKKLQFFLQKL